MDDKCILRVEKLTTRGRGKGSLYKSLKHLDNHKKSADITRPELSHLNRSSLKLKEQFSYKEVLSLCDKLRTQHNKQIDEWNATHDKPKKRHLKEDASQCFEVLLSFSPNAEEKINLDEWRIKNIEFVKKEFAAKGCQCVRCELHRDEKTCHLSFVFVAFDKTTKRSCTRDILGGNKELSELQDRYAEAMKPFNLERGVSRYKEYDSVRKKAISAGYGADLKSVEQYALDNNIKLPKRRRHQSIKQYKAELQQQILELEKTYNDLKRDTEYLEKYFTDHPERSQYHEAICLAFRDQQDFGTLKKATENVFLDDEQSVWDYAVDLFHDYIEQQKKQQMTRDDDDPEH